jgi:ssDNA-binding Zn-finger/Zn-ribbon topoisomerase 1
VKTCFKCNTEKPVRDFYRHAQMADGYLGKCKECTKADVSRYWAENSAVLRQTDAVRRKAKKQATNSVSRAIRDGRLMRGTECHYCSATEGIEAHHWTYYRPLDVTWLCKRCHRIADMARRDAEAQVAIAT